MKFNNEKIELRNRVLKKNSLPRTLRYKSVPGDMMTSLSALIVTKADNCHKEKDVIVDNSAKKWALKLIKK